MLNKSAFVGKRILKVFVISINISSFVFKIIYESQYPFL